MCLDRWSIIKEHSPYPPPPFPLLSASREEINVTEPSKGLRDFVTFFRVVRFSDITAIFVIMDSLETFSSQGTLIRGQECVCVAEGEGGG